MNIADKIGVIPPVEWLFNLLPSEVWGVYIPLQYGIGLALPLGMLFVLALGIENRWPRITKQYYSVKYGFPFLAIAIGIGLAIVDHLPDVQDAWYRDSWWAPLYHLGLIVFGLLMALKLKLAEIRESYTKRNIWYAVNSDKVTTDWLNTDHTDQGLFDWLRKNNRDSGYSNDLVRSLKYGVAYSWRQHWSATALGHLLAATGMAYLTGLVVPAAFTAMIVRGKDIQQPWWYVGGMFAMLVALFLFYRTTRWDNTKVRPKLTYVHPDKYPLPILWKPIRALVRWVKSRSSSEFDPEFSDFGPDPQERDRLSPPDPQVRLSELFDPDLTVEPDPVHTDGRTPAGEAYQPSFGQRFFSPDAIVVVSPPVLKDEEKEGNKDSDRAPQQPYGYGQLGSSQAVLAPPGAYTADDLGLSASVPVVPVAAEPAPTPSVEPDVVITPRPLDAEESQTVRQTAIDAVDPRQQVQGTDDTQPPAPEPSAPQQTGGMRIGTPTSPVPGEARSSGGMRIAPDTSGSQDIPEPGVQPKADTPTSGSGRATGGMRIGTPTSPVPGEARSSGGMRIAPDAQQ